MESKKRFLFKRRLTIFKRFFTSHALRHAALKIAADHLYTATQSNKQRIFSRPLDQIFQDLPVVHLAPVSRVDGNLSYYELMVLAAFVSILKPMTLLEIGTFNGLTTLHMALNSPEEALIHTLDLTEAPSYPSDPHDLQYIVNKEKAYKKYTLYPHGKKIQEHLGNSFLYPFSRFEPSELIFIDGGHTYENVKNDTLHALDILSPYGCILWHDYTPNCPGVFRYLNELAQSHPIIQIQGTSLVYLKKTL